MINYALFRIRKMEAGIPKKTKKIIDDIFQLNLPSLRNQHGRIREIAERYYGNPSEMLARKQVIDKKMADQGIKTYEEPFKLEHLFKLVLAENKEIYKALDIKVEKGKDFTEEQSKKIQDYIIDNGYPEGFEFLNLIDITNQDAVERFFNEVAASDKDRDSLKHEILA